MSVTFTKLFSSITESTVWCEPDRVRLVWITLLAMADKHGRVWGSVPGIANRARVPVEDARDALRRFLEPDADSRTPDNDGRRIETIDGGWRLLNHQKYRSVRDEEDRREYQRVKKSESRQRLSTKSKMSTNVNTNSHNAEADADAEAVKNKNKNTLALPHSEFLSAWNESRGSLPKVLGLSTPRAKRLSERIKAGLTLDQFTEAVQLAARTPFLRGDNEKKWACSFDFLVKNDENVLKILEGQYGEPDAAKKVWVDVTDTPAAAAWLTGGANA